uniref:SUZ RNA-binding domain-containing n=1 Tax=Takifugu rubripes TaxID=31033 RepID=H2TQX6_TAKRU
MEDEEVAESWEEAADSGVRIQTTLSKSSSHCLSDTVSLISLFCSYIIRKTHLGSGGSPVRTAIVIQDDSLPAAPPPQIRILKRPTNNGTSGNPASLSRPTQQMKSLAQREAEYAEARRRILGSDQPIYKQTPEAVRPNNHVIRQPTGPDGTSGFRLCR